MVIIWGKVEKRMDVMDVMVAEADCATSEILPRCGWSVRFIVYEDRNGEFQGCLSKDKILQCES